MERVSSKTINLVRNVTRIDVESYFQDFISFHDSLAQNIVQFYSGDTEIKDRESFTAFNGIKRRTRSLLNSIDQNSNSFQNYEFFTLTEQVEDINTYLSTLENTPKYAKTVLQNGSFVRRIIIQYTKQRNDSLERINRDILGNADNDSWTEIAVQNRITEEQMRGDNDLQMNLNLGNGEGIIIENVMKGIEEAKDTFGKDIDRQITFVDDDFKALSEDETLEQTVLILLGMIKGDNPYDREYGIERALIGSSSASFGFNTVIRNITENFGSDDTFQNLEIRDIRQEGEAVFVDVLARTKTGAFIERNGARIG